METFELLFWRTNSFISDKCHVYATQTGLHTARHSTTHLEHCKTQRNVSPMHMANLSQVNLLLPVSEQIVSSAMKASFISLPLKLQTTAVFCFTKSEMNKTAAAIIRHAMSALSRFRFSWARVYICQKYRIKTKWLPWLRSIVSYVHYMFCLLNVRMIVQKSLAIKIFKAKQ